MGQLNFFEKILIPTYEDPKQMQLGEVEFDYDKCRGCPICVEACPADSLLLRDGKPFLKSAPDNACIACGDCVAICPDKAIRLTRGYHFTKFYKTIDQGELMAPRLFVDE